MYKFQALRPRPKKEPTNCIKSENWKILRLERVLLKIGIEAKLPTAAEKGKINAKAFIFLLL